MQEREIVQAAIQHLQQLTGIEIKEVAPSAHRGKSHRQPDTAVEMETTGKRFFFWVEVKNELRQLHLAHLIDSLGHDAENWMLICQYLSKSNRAQLKKENINYLDASGNCHIRKGTLFLFMYYILALKCNVVNMSCGFILEIPSDLEFPDLRLQLTSHLRQTVGGIGNLLRSFL